MSSYEAALMIGNAGEMVPEEAPNFLSS